MPRKSWCPGNSSCKHCKPGESRVQQHAFSKLVRETNSPQIPSSLSRQIVLDVEYLARLRRRKLMGTTFGNLDPVPFDPNVDPEPYACLICWSLLHMTRHCQEIATHIYCWNCGRKDVEVEECPRCARAYCEYREKKKCIEKETLQFRKALRKSIRSLKEEDLRDDDAEFIFTEKKSNDSCFVGANKQFSTLKKNIKQEDTFEEDGRDEVNNTCDNMSVNPYEKCKIKEQVKCKDEPWSEVDEKNHKPFSPTDFRVDDASFTAKLEKRNASLTSTPFVSPRSDDYLDPYNDFHNSTSNELFTYMRNQKIQNQLELDRVKNEAKSKYFSESEYYFFDEEEENYDDYIVDEDEKSGLLHSEDYAIRFFVDLLDALKHLSIDMQNTAVLNFVSARKKQICRQRKMAQEGS